jgi:hypothetical protein
LRRAVAALSAAPGRLILMSEPAEVLMLTGVVRPCPDCHGERIFMPAEACDGDVCDYCCTTCGAAVMIDPALDLPVVMARVA